MRLSVSVYESHRGRFRPVKQDLDTATDVIEDLLGYDPGVVEVNWDTPEVDNDFWVSIPEDTVREHTNLYGLFVMENEAGQIVAVVGGGL